VVVVPVTGNVTSLFPGEAKVTVAGREGRVLGAQVRSVDKARLGKRIGRLLRSDVDAVDDALRTTLDPGGP
jgi:mRNA interferase MazF